MKAIIFYELMCKNLGSHMQVSDSATYSTNYKMEGQKNKPRYRRCLDSANQCIAKQKPGHMIMKQEVSHRNTGE